MWPGFADVLADPAHSVITMMARTGLGMQNPSRDRAPRGAHTARQPPFSLRS
jgi:hypothetical protein